GLIGRNVVSRLVAQGHDAVAASPATGVDTITGKGLADVVVGADVVVDVSNAPVWDDDAVMKFFTTSSRNLLAAERYAGVGHHVAVSIVGVDRLPDSGYLRAKVAQEAEIEAGAIPYTILCATQFFEFLPQILEAGAKGNSVRLSTGLIQFVAADDVAATVAELAIGAPVGERVELGGPEALGINAWARRLFTATRDNRAVIADPHARYDGTELHGGELTPGAGARIGKVERHAKTRWDFSRRAGRCRPDRPHEFVWTCARGLGTRQSSPNARATIKVARSAPDHAPWSRGRTSCVQTRPP